MESCTTFGKQVNPLSLISTIVDTTSTHCNDSAVNPLSLISTIVDWNSTGFFWGVNPLSLISTIVDLCDVHGWAVCQSSFFNFYYCRLFADKFHGTEVNPLSLISTIVDSSALASSWLVVNPLSLISTIVDRRGISAVFRVNPLSLISTIVDSACFRAATSVYPLSLISTIVDSLLTSKHGHGQSSFFNFYYCRWEK